MTSPMSGTMTDPQELQLTMRRLIDGVWNDEDPSVAEEIVAPRFSLPGREVPGGLEGPELYRRLADQTREAFPDMVYTIEDVLVDAEKVAVRWTMRGTHEGVLFGVSPTGATVEVPGIEIDRFEDELLVASWIQTDELGILEQIGGLPPV